MATRTAVAGEVLTASNANDYYLSASRLIVQYEFASALPSLTISGIPGTYQHLSLVGHGRGSAAASTIEANLTLNNDTAANYARLSWDASDVSPTPTGAWSTDRTSVEAFIFAGASLSASSAGAGHLIIADYASTTWFKDIISNSAAFDGDTGCAARQRRMFWKSTVAVTRIDLTASSGNFVIGTTFSLYGIG